MLRLRLSLGVLLSLSCLLRRLLLRLLFLRPLFTPSGNCTHGSADRCSFSRVARDGSDGSAARGYSGSALGDLPVARIAMHPQGDSPL